MYAKYYKFNGKPFGLHPDPKFFFNSNTHKRALSCLGYGLSQGQGFVVITGGAGTGKTTLMLALLHMLAQTNILTAKIINTQLQSDEMLRYVAAELGLTYEGQSKVSLLKSIEALLQKCRSREQRIIIIIDEAQNLSDSALEELRMLMNLVKGNEALLQFVLFGQTRLQEHIYTESFEPLRQRIVTSYNLDNLSEEETKAYIQQRLRTVYWVGDPEFSPGAFIAIHEYTSGIPAKINMLCGKILQAACLNGSHVITEEDIQNIIRELSSNFSDTEFKGSLVEGVIDSMIARPLDKPSLEKPLLSEKEAVEQLDTRNTEEIVITNYQKDDDQAVVPLVSDRITIDQALVEVSSIRSDEEMDTEIEHWLTEQKKRIRSSKNKAEEFSRKSNINAVENKFDPDDAKQDSKLHSPHQMESTIEDPHT